MKKLYLMWTDNVMVDTQFNQVSIDADTDREAWILVFYLYTVSNTISLEATRIIRRCRSSLSGFPGNYAVEYTQRYMHGTEVKLIILNPSTQVYNHVSWSVS